MEAPAQQTSPTKPIRSRRRWLQYSLRWLLVIVTVSGVGLGLVVRRERQRKAVAEVRAAGGWMSYDFQEPAWPAVGGKLPGPDWLCRRLGVDYFAKRD